MHVLCMVVIILYKNCEAYQQSLFCYHGIHNNSTLYSLCTVPSGRNHHTIAYFYPIRALSIKCKKSI